MKLLLLIGLGLAFLLGQGWALIGPMLHGSLATPRRVIPLLQELPLVLLSGLIINYGIVLSVQSLSISLLAGSVIAGFGVCVLALYVYRFRLRQPLESASWTRWIAASSVCLLFLGQILTEPLRDWDARSIWFFHAKMIYAAGSVGQSAGWQVASVAFSHPDYPELVPALAAQVSYLLGFWNEYIPKLSLFFMLVPAVLWLFSFARRSFGFAFLVLLVVFSFRPWLWNGYMDGFLALYFPIALLLLGRYIDLSQPIDLVSSLGCLVILVYTKNEGALLAVCGLCSMGLAYLVYKRSVSTGSALVVNWKYCLGGLIAVLPFVVWSFYKLHWNLSGYLGIGTPQSFARVFSRLSDGSYMLILQSTYRQIEGPLLLLGVSWFAAAAWKQSLPRESLPALVAAGTYCLGLMSIYLLTPYDLAWQLDTSIERTMLPVSGCIYVAVYSILNGIQKNEDVLRQEALYTDVGHVRPTRSTRDA